MLWAPSLTLEYGGPWPVGAKGGENQADAWKRAPPALGLDFDLLPDPSKEMTGDRQQGSGEVGGRDSQRCSHQMKIQDSAEGWAGAEKCYFTDGQMTM